MSGMRVSFPHKLKRCKSRYVEMAEGITFFTPCSKDNITGEVT